MTAPNGNPVFNWSGSGAYPLSDIDTSPPSGAWYANVDGVVNANVGLTNYIYEVLVDAGLIEGG